MGASRVAWKMSPVCAVALSIVSIKRTTTDVPEGTVTVASWGGGGGVDGTCAGGSGAGGGVRSAGGGGGLSARAISPDRDCDFRCLVEEDLGVTGSRIGVGEGFDSS